MTRYRLGIIRDAIVAVVVGLPVLIAVLIAAGGTT